LPRRPATPEHIELTPDYDPDEKWVAPSVVKVLDLGKGTERWASPTLRQLEQGNKLVRVGCI